jgi:hypothetical protein
MVVRLVRGAARIAISLRLRDEQLVVGGQYRLPVGIDVALDQTFHSLQRQRLEDAPVFRYPVAAGVGMFT